MTPDKIYIADNVFPTHVDWDGSPINTKRIESSDIEYIRKDTLLEWAKNLKEKWEEPPMSRYSPGCSFMLKQVINKIESL